MKHIFLISGEAQHGKDSTANIIKELLLPEKTLILHNADYLKYIATQYMDWDGNKDEKGRTLLQQLGTNKIRLELKRPLYWIERTCDVIEFLSDYYDYFCVPDSRFVNELHYPIARFPNKVTSIRVTRLNFDNGLTEEQKNHVSECELKNYPHDYYIESISGLDNLKIEVEKFIRKL